MKNKIQTVAILAFAFISGMGAGHTMLVSGAAKSADLPHDAASLPADAAFRDGLFLGTQAALRGEQPHISLGRWSSAQDRNSFAAGYDKGYWKIVKQRRQHGE